MYPGNVHILVFRENGDWVLRQRRNRVRLGNLEVIRGAAAVQSGILAAHNQGRTTGQMRFFTRRQSSDGSIPVARVGGKNFAHSWHTMLVRQRGFAVERSAMFYFREARFTGLSGGECLEIGAEAPRQDYAAQSESDSR